MSEKIDRNKKTFWPYGILLSIFAVFVACVVTVVISLDYPVYMDNAHFEKYQKVELRYNEIQIAQANFDKEYKVKFIHNDNYKTSNDINLSLEIVPQTSNGSCDKISKEIVVTRRFTTKEDMNLNATCKNNILLVEPFKVKDKGIWQLLLKLSQDDKVGLFKFEFNVNPA